MKHTLKSYNTETCFREFPDEITLAINISNCPNHCPGCHSKWLWKDDGDVIAEDYIDNITKPHITCIGLMGGDQDPEEILNITKYIKEKHPDKKVGWYSGRTNTELFKYNILDYIKTGPYIKEFGGLDCKNTNQKIYKLTDHGYVDITKEFQRKGYK